MVCGTLNPIVYTSVWIVGGILEKKKEDAALGLEILC